MASLERSLSPSSKVSTSENSGAAASTAALGETVCISVPKLVGPGSISSHFSYAIRKESIRWRVMSNCLVTMTF